MRKKMILRLSVLAVFLTLLWSCRSEDFAKIETNPQRNNSDFFKYRSSLSAKNTTDYIRILEEYNQETDFLSGIPDQKGMPIWDKMKVVETKEATGLTIPLSYDNETMSSLLFVILDAKNAVNGIRNMTNANLESLVYNPGYSIRSRESLMNTFIMMDYHTFGNEVFTNIPTDLFAGHKEGENNNRLIYKGDHGDFTNTVEYNSEGKILVIYNTTCTTSWHCKNDKPIGYCDGCSKCKSTTCSTTITTIFTDGNDDFPTWEGGGGGGTPMPPKDPCGLASVFYRPAPGCGGGGTIPEIDNPCKKTKASIDKADKILKNAEVKQKMDAVLKEKFQASNEWAVAVGQKPDNSYEVTPAIEQSATSGNIPSNLLTSTYVADGHSHAGGHGNPSGGDLYNMIASLAGSPALKYRFIYGNSDSGTPEVYALVINNPTLAQQFLSEYPKDENYDSQYHFIKAKSKLGVDFYKANAYYLSGASDNSSGENYDSRAVAMAYILDKYNVGISIAKADANGNLKKINAEVTQITIPYSGGAVKEGVKVSKCP